MWAQHVPVINCRTCSYRLEYRGREGLIELACRCEPRATLLPRSDVGLPTQFDPSTRWPQSPRVVAVSTETPGFSCLLSFDDNLTNADGHHKPWIEGRIPEP